MDQPVPNKSPPHSPNPTPTIESLSSQIQSLSHQHTTLRLHPDATRTQSLFNFGLYGKVIADVDLCRKPLKEKILESWNLLHEAQASLVGVNTFLFKFASAADRSRVLLQGPWSVFGYHLVLKPWEANKAPQEIDFSTTDLWLQAHNLPLEYCTEENAKAISCLFHKFLEFDNEGHQRSIKQTYIRLKVEHKIAYPLPSGFDQERENMPSLWIQFKYERISDFCYNCGRLGHTNYGCTVKIISDLPKQERSTTSDRMGLGC